jgi:hypothetical protein
MNITAIPSKTPQLPIFVRDAVSEQQARVRRLRNLIECVRYVDREQIDDYEAAISGLVDYADDIHLALDVGTVAERAETLRAESHGPRNP